MTLPNGITQNNSLSLEARGLLAYLLSLPDSNGATVEKITSRVPNGRRSVSNAMNELIQAGYVARVRVQDPETGRWVTITSVTDMPTDHMPTVGVPTGQAVGASPKEKEPEGKNLPPVDQVQEQRPEGRAASEGEGESPAGETNTAKAVALLGSLGSRDNRLRLSMSETVRLAPLAEAWLSEGFTEPQITKTLTAALPASVQSSAALLTHRLRTFRPEPVSEPQRPSQPVVRAECPECFRPFPAGHAGGLCRDCR
ncbi:helix-turn-helix domain-containing protein [Streptomyces sp. NPDC003328]